MNPFSDLLPVTLANGFKPLNNVNFVPKQDIVPGWACPLFRELYNYAFFQLCECRWDGQDTKPDSLFPSLCEITEHNRAYIYTQPKSSGLGFYKSSRWQILLEGVVLPYLQHSKRKIYTFAVQTSFNASLRARGTAQMARSHTHPLFIPSPLTGV